MESRTLATAHVGRSWIAYQRIYKFSAIYRVIPCCCRLNTGNRGRFADYRAASIRTAAYVAWSWNRKPMGVTWCSLVIGSAFYRETASNDDRWPLPGPRFASNPKRKADYCEFHSRCWVLLHKSFDTRDNAAFIKFLWGLRQPWAGTRTKHSAKPGNSARRCLVCFVARVTFSLKSLFSETSCDDCVLRRGSATCVDSFWGFLFSRFDSRQPGRKFRGEGSGLISEQIETERDKAQMPTRHRQSWYTDLHVTALDSMHSTSGAAIHN